MPHREYKILGATQEEFLVKLSKRHSVESVYTDVQKYRYIFHDGGSTLKLNLFEERIDKNVDLCIYAKTPKKIREERSMLEKSLKIKLKLFKE